MIDILVNPMSNFWNKSILQKVAESVISIGITIPIKVHPNLWNRN